ncbi:MAG TPA: hypothetical protein VF070_21675 [Streptosporangiaceae bacterium]
MTPITHRDNQDFLHLRLCFSQRQIVEALTLSEVIPVHHTQKDSGHLEPARDGNDLRIDRQRDASEYFSREYLRRIISAEPRQAPGCEPAEEAMHLLFSY